jgi:surfactin synthase thioesterase subunit
VKQRVATPEPRVPSTHAIWEPLPRPRASHRLLCLPGAGAGVNLFRGWERVLGADVEVASVQLPGREWRREEPPLRSIDEVAALLLPEATEWLRDPRPTALFGYGTGAVVAFALASRLQTAARGPDALFVAACPGPRLLAGGPALQRLRDRAFLDTLDALRVAPRAAWREAGLYDLGLPLLRADLEVLERFAPPAGPLRCPIHAYGGDAEPVAGPAELAAWSDCTTAAFELRVLRGDHLFIPEERRHLLRALALDLASVQALPAT